MRATLAIDSDSACLTSGLVWHFHLVEYISSFRDFAGCYHFQSVLHIKFLKTKSVDPVQTPHLAASELGLNCLQVSPERVSSLKRLKY